MPNAGDTFIVEIKEPHIGWGTERHTNTRTIRHGEGYIKIPRAEAVRFSIYNCNRQNANILYDVVCLNGNQINGRLLAQGSEDSNDVYAKQFSVQGDLRQVGQWYASVHAVPGGRVRITFTSETSLELEYLPPNNA